MTRYARTVQGIDWEAIFVDHDSQNGTPEAVCRLASQDRRVRRVQRVGRRRASFHSRRRRRLDIGPPLVAMAT